MQITEDKLMELLAAAYMRGAAWIQENIDPEYVAKAANDYADATVSTLKIDGR